MSLCIEGNDHISISVPFQEFADPDWDASAADPHDEQQWQDDWDDDKTDDDFSKQLRAELEKQAAKQPAS